MKLYLETSVLNFLFASDAPEKMEITHEFFRKLGDNEVFISELVLEEIEKSPEPKRILLRGVVNAYKLRAVKITGDAEELARKYVSEGIIPDKYYNDALHIALTTLYEMDVIVSWNMKHIVKLKTLAGVRDVNEKLNYKGILICTPEEAIE